MLQAELYKQIAVYLGRIKDFSSLTQGSALDGLQLDPDLEKQFSGG